ncbi:MAG: hypothetical protein K9J27_12020 [Bacteroidales bacterium]|nr:hypothetical protein [Bacteroidales bacterium]
MHESIVRRSVLASPSSFFGFTRLFKDGPLALELLLVWSSAYVVQQPEARPNTEASVFGTGRLQE